MHKMIRSIPLAATVAWKHNNFQRENDIIFWCDTRVLVHCCIPVSLLIGGWDWVQGGNPLYAAVKCLSDRRGQIWRIFFNFFAKSTCHIHFPGGIFFGGSKKMFYPLKWAISWGHRHFSKIEGPFPKLRGRAVRGPQALCFGMFF